MRFCICIYIHVCICIYICICTCIVIFIFIVAFFGCCPILYSCICSLYFCICVFVFIKDDVLWYRTNLDLAAGSLILLLLWLVSNTKQCKLLPLDKLDGGDEDEVGGGFNNRNIDLSCNRFKRRQKKSMNIILSHFHTLFVKIKKYLKDFRALWTGWSKPNSSIDQIFAGPELFTWCTPPQCIEWISNRRKSNPSKIIATSNVINTWFWRYLQLWDPLVLMQICKFVQSVLL